MYSYHILQEDIKSKDLEKLLAQLLKDYAILL